MEIIQMRLLLAPSVLILLGCAGLFVTEDNFPTRAASAWCSRLAECDAAEFEKNFDEHEDCLEFLEPHYDCRTAFCDFDIRSADDYLADLRNADCSEDESDLEDVYDDCDDVELAACYSGS